VSTVCGAGSQDHYAVLGVGRDANPQDIHRAYRALARRYHPDVYGGHDAEPRFTKISAAYEVLHNPAKRALYDAVPARRASAEPGRARSFPEWTAGRASGNAPTFIDEEPERPVAGAPSARAAVRVPWPGRAGLLFGCVIEVSDWRC
jgi:DnaJ-class molecular chaperone